jgi:hypothetical protein
MNAHVITPTPKLSTSLEFYAKLGFTVIPANGSTLVSDGQVLIEIDPERTARAGIKFFDADHSRKLDALSGTFAIHRVEAGHLLSDPNGIRVVLSEREAPAADMKGITPGITGNFAGLSIETTEMERSVEFWSALGYAITMGEASKGWVSLEADGCPGISLMKSMMCPHLFFNPSLTYFNGKEGNPKVIEAVRKEGIPITEEITHFNKEGLVDNIIIRDPGGLGFFLFND